MHSGRIINWPVVGVAEWRQQLTHSTFDRSGIWHTSQRDLAAGIEARKAKAGVQRGQHNRDDHDEQRVRVGHGQQLLGE